jgi:Protein of unknown function (DUF2795)
MQGGDRHSRWLDDALTRVRGVEEEETTDTRLWDAPGHDGVVTEADSDPDKAQLRSDIGQYVSLVHFPADAHTLVSVAESKGAPDHVVDELASLDEGERFADTTKLWAALGLGSSKRF